MRRLIINADDLGADASRNRGIFELAARGAITDASLLVTTPGFEDAVVGLKRVNLHVGLHFNVSEGDPVGGPYKTLTGANGQFLGKEEIWHRGLAGVLDPAEVHAEATAQVHRMRQAGIEPTHLDGHQHVHLLPAVSAGLVAVAMTRRVRMATEDPDGTVLASPDKAPFVRRVLEAARASRPIWEAGGWRWPRALLGAGLVGGVHVGSLLRLFDLCAEGVTEILVHPGYPQLDSLPFSSADREIELEALLDPRLKDALYARGLQLTSWSEF